MFYEGFGKSMKEEIKNYTYMLLCADGRITPDGRIRSANASGRTTVEREPNTRRPWAAKAGVSGDLGYERGGNETGGCHKKADAEGKRGC